MSVSRRKFLGYSGGVLGGAAAGYGSWAALTADQVEKSRSVASPSSSTTTTTTTTLADLAEAELTSNTKGRVLVVIQLSGGNDGLNTVVPTFDGKYYDRRTRVGIPDSELLALPGNDQYGLHPSLEPLVDIYQAEDLAIIQNVGMHGQSRSHFSAMDTWWSATPGLSRTSGWLGRWLDATGDGSNPLRAVALVGGGQALQGDKLQATFVRNPEQFSLLTPAGADGDQIVQALMTTAEPLSSDTYVAAAQQAVPASFEALELLALAEGQEATDIFRTPGVRGVGVGNSNMVTLLETTAGIIDQQLGTDVIVVGMNGYDTHDTQLSRHSELLSDLSNGMNRFNELMEEQGRSEEVLVLVTSEFGRRVTDNANLGTDHGTAGTLFLMGKAVSGGQLVGDINLDNLTDGDLTIDIDTRSLYQIALDWLGGPTEAVLNGTFDDLGLVAV